MERGSRYSKDISPAFKRAHITGHKHIVSNMIQGSAELS